MIKIQSPSEITEIAKRLRVSQESLRTMPEAEIIEFLDQLGKKLISRDYATVPGIAFLASWLTKKNLQRLLENQLGNQALALDQFLPLSGFQVRAAPAGLATHWIAGNVPTLGFFSWALSAMCKNANLIRVSSGSVGVFSVLLKIFQDFEQHPIVKSTAWVTFPSDRLELNKQLSTVSDLRVVWGGADAVAAVTALPRMDHATDVVFGPKYSFCVMDRDAIKNQDKLPTLVRALARDLAAFDQQACSSPHVVFVEGSFQEVQPLCDLLQVELKRMADTRPFTQIEEANSAAILRARTDYGLSQDKDLKAPADLQYTILIDQKPDLPEGLQYRSVFVKAVKSLDEALPWVTPKIQTIGVAILDAEKKRRFTESAALLGVSRLCEIGSMHNFDAYWDSMKVMDRMVRWATLS